MLISKNDNADLRFVEKYLVDEAFHCFGLCTPGRDIVPCLEIRIVEGPNLHTFNTFASASALLYLKANNPKLLKITSIKLPCLAGESYFKSLIKGNTTISILQTF